MSRTKGKPNRRRAPEQAGAAWHRKLAPYRTWLILVGSGLVIALLAGMAAARWASRPMAAPQVDLANAEPRVRERVEAALTTQADAPNDPEAWGNLGMLYDAHAFRTEAVACYRQAAALAPKDARWPYLIALALTQEQPEDAVSALEEAVNLGARGVAVHWNLGNLLADLGQPERARGEMLRALEDDPASASALAGLGRIAIMQDQWEEATQRLEQALALDPTSAEVHTLLAQAYRQRGRDADAERMAALARGLADEDPAGPPDPIFDAVVERGTSSRWLIRRARARHRAGRPDEAEALFREAVTAAPGEPAALVGLGLIRQARGDRAGAIDLYRQALATDADHVEALSNLGLALAQTGEYQAGAAQLERALEIAPGQLVASMNLALLRLDQSRPQDAIALVEPLRRAHPSDPRVANTLAQALAAAGRFDDAAREWKESVAIQPTQEPVWIGWSSAASAAGRHAEAIAILRDGLTRLPASTLLQGTLAWELATAPGADLRRGPEALALAEGVVRAMPVFGQSYDILAAAQAETGNIEGAIASAEKALNLQAAGDEAVTALIQARLALYRRGEAYRQPE